MVGWKAAQLRGYLGKELSEQYSGGGEATLSRHEETTYADDFAEWAYSYIRMSTGWLLFYCDTKHTASTMPRGSTVTPHTDYD